MKLTEKTYIIPLLALWLLMLTSCSSPTGEGFPLVVRLQMPEGFTHLCMEGTELKLINTTNGTSYTTRANSSGIAIFDVEYGIYRLSAQLSWQKDAYTGHLFNAGYENLRLTPSGGVSASDTISLQLSDSPLSLILIKEIYYSGSRDDNGRNYTRDGYVSLYNNSDQTVWLDSLCFSLIAPINALKPSPWLAYNDNLLPVQWIGWQFPGTGHDHPLLPGQETIIAINAIDHTSPVYNHPNSVNLSNVDWAFHHPGLVSSDKAAGVTSLIPFWQNGTPAFIFSITGSCMALYRIPGITAQEYAEHPENIHKEPNTSINTNYLMIPREWIIDCVDCVGDASKQGFKRVPSQLDAEATFLPSGLYSGRSLHRKVIGSQNGHPIYQDSNNSANDFEERIPTRR